MISAVLGHTEGKLCYSRSSCNLTNIGLLTIGKHYTSTESGAFLHFGASEVQDIGTANTEMHHQREKPLIYKDLGAIINDKKKTVGRHYPYQSTVPYL